MTDFESSAVSLERLEEYSSLAAEAPWRQPGEEALLASACAQDKWPDEGRIEFLHYSTRYREGLEPVLDQLSLAINQREKIGVCGRTGVTCDLRVSLSLISY